LIIPQVQVTQGCNLACRYCFQDHSRRGVMEEKILEAVIDRCVAYNRRLAPHLSTMEFLWHGGEPLLGGLDFFKRIVSLQSRYPGLRFQNKVQTNGLAMTEECASFLVDREFLVGFSIDGPEDLHDAHRKMGDGTRGSFKEAMRGIGNFRTYCRQPLIPVIAVVTKETVMRGAKVFYEFFRDLGAAVQLDPYDMTCFDLQQEGFSIEASPYIPSPESYGRFVIDLFDLWFHDEPGKVEFRDLKNEIKLLLTPQARIESIPDKKRCSPFRTIIDPGGLLFSCDQYVNNDTTALGSILEDPLERMMEKKFSLWEAIKKTFRGKGRPFSCSSCTYGALCPGGCITCMKYNCLLLKGLSLAEEPPDEVIDALSAFFPERGDSLYCQSFRLYRPHIEKSVAREMNGDHA
jgi:uncharacterized protein